MKTALEKFNYRRASYYEVCVAPDGERYAMRVEHTRVKDYQCVPELQHHCSSVEEVVMSRGELHDEIGEVLKEGGG